MNERDAWWEEGKKRLDECIKKQKARDERIVNGWDEFKIYIPKPISTAESVMIYDRMKK